MPFGKQLKSKSRPTNIIFRKQRVYEVTEDVLGTPLQKGDLFYLDPGDETNHLEVFTKRGRSRTVLNLDGSINCAKAESAANRTIKF
jgi:hypothetical protein